MFVKEFLIFFFYCSSSQDKSIEEQLSMGIRFFDLRIAHKPKDSSSDLYFMHVIYTHLTVMVSIIILMWSFSLGFWSTFIVNVLPSQETLLSVATWLESHPKEIVILACSHFEGIDDRLHQAFIFSLKKLFGSKLCPQKVSSLIVQLIYGVKTAQCLTQPRLASTGTSPDLAASVGIWLPGHPVVWLPDCSRTSGAMACRPLLVGQPAHRTGCDQLPGLQKRPGTSRWSLHFDPHLFCHSGAFSWAYMSIFLLFFFDRGLLRLWPEPDGWQVLHHREPEAVPADADLQ